jgi:hypothetical protein
MSKKKTRKDKVSESESSAAVAEQEVTGTIELHESLQGAGLAETVGEPRGMSLVDQAPTPTAVEDPPEGVEEDGDEETPEEGNTEDDVLEEEMAIDLSPENSAPVEAEPEEGEPSVAPTAAAAPSTSTIDLSNATPDQLSALAQIAKLQEAIAKATGATGTAAAAKKARVTNPRTNVVYNLKLRPPNWCKTPQVHALLDVLYSQDERTEFTEPELFAILKEAGESGKIRTRQAGGAWHIFSYYLSDLIKHNVITRH